MMKTVKMSMLLGLLFIVLAATTCNKEDVKNNTISQVENIVKSGNWRITYFFDSNSDKTSSFNGYTFTFANSNVVTAVKSGSTTVNGTWSVTDSNSNDDSISDLHFNLLFTTPSQFAELNDDWELVEKSNTIIKFKDVSGGNGGIDYLTFTKN